MEKLKKSTLKTTRGFEYTYYTSQAKDGHSTVLLVHGWPDTAELWEGFITNYLIPAGFGVVAPDCLGYGGTSKPTDPNAYNVKLMSNDVAEILDKEGLEKVISLGHDWGNAVSQGLWLFHPDRVKGLIMLNVAYLIPTTDPFSLDDVLAKTAEAFGYGIYWYWKFFTSDKAADLILSNLDSCFDMAHGKPETWIDIFCQPGATETFITEGKRQPVEPYASEEMRRKFKERILRDKFDGPLSWYRAMTFGIHDEAYSSVSDQNKMITVPTLFWGGARDMVCRPELIGQAVDAGLIPDLTVVTIDAGHWALLAKPDKFGQDLMAWMGKKVLA